MTTTTNFNEYVAAVEQTTVMNNSITTEEESNITIDTQTIDTHANNNNNNNSDGDGERKRNRSYYQKESDIIISGCNKVVTCRVEGCSTTCEYHYEIRARVCWEHLRAESVRFANSACGFKRFCQKCTRFEDLHLFDGKKRACRASLAKLASKRRGNYEKGDDENGRDGGGGSLVIATIANINNDDVPEKDESYKDDSKQQTIMVSDEEDDEKKLDIIDVAEQLVNIIALDEMRKKTKEKIATSGISSSSKKRCFDVDSARER